MNSIETINKNANGVEGSFVWNLNNGSFEVNSFWEYFTAINKFNGEVHNLKHIESIVVANYSKAQSIILNALTCHYNPNDFYHIKNIDKIPISDYYRRLTTIFSSFGEGAFENDDFDDELAAPIFLS